MNFPVKNQFGFSLLEVLVAFSIFALGLGVIFQIYSTGTRSTVLSDEYARAVIIAQSRLAGVGIDEAADIGDDSGIENDKYQWTTRIQAIDDNDFDLETKFNMSKREVEVVVNWDSHGKNRFIKLSTIKLVPTT